MNSNNQRPTHAHRRPESVRNNPHSPQQRPEQTRPSQTYAKRQELNGRNQTHRPSQDYRFEAGRRRQSSNQTATPVRRVTALTPADQKKLQKAEQKRLVEQIKEEAWQKDVVRVRGGIDIIMLAIILLLLALGTITVFSASYPVAIAKGYDGNYYSMNQIKFLIMGGVGMFVMTILPIRFYKNWAPIAGYVLSAVLLAYTAVAGMAEGEAKRWVNLGLFNLQPSELMKISLVLILAWYVDRYEKRMKRLDLGFESLWWNTWLPCVILGGACVLVLIGKHLSGTIIVGCIGLFMLIVAGCNLKWLFGSLVPAGIVAIGGFLALNPYALKRITTFTDENADKLDELYQTTQSIYAIGSGGLFGVGLGESRQKYSFLTQAHTDFIFSVWCEEWGFIGAVVLIIIFLLFTWRGYVIAQRAPDRFTQLTAFGITTHVALQAFLNMCVAADIIMNTGITLPFFSYGGSSLVVLMAEMGILLCISRQSYKKKADIEREAMMKQIGLE